MATRLRPRLSAPTRAARPSVLERLLSAWAWVAAVLLVLIGFFYVAAIWLVTAPFDPGRYQAGRALRRLAVSHVKLTRLWRF